MVYYQDGDLLAFVELKFGRNGVWVQPFIHPDAAGFDKYLFHLLQDLPSRGNRPLYICVRSYQSWLESAIERMGAATRTATSCHGAPSGIIPPGKSNLPTTGD